MLQFQGKSKKTKTTTKKTTSPKKQQQHSNIIIQIVLRRLAFSYISFCYWAHQLHLSPQWNSPSFNLCYNAKEVARSKGRSVWKKIRLALTKDFCFFFFYYFYFPAPICRLCKCKRESAPDTNSKQITYMHCRSQRKSLTKQLPYYIWKEIQLVWIMGGRLMWIETQKSSE